MYLCTDTDHAVEPGAFSCSGNCLLTTCEILCLEPETVSCARLTSTSLTVKRDDIIVQQITQIGSSDVDFTLNDLSPSTEYFITVRAENIVGYTLVSMTLLTLNGE